MEYPVLRLSEEDLRLAFEEVDAADVAAATLLWRRPHTRRMDPARDRWSLTPYPTRTSCPPAKGSAKGVVLLHDKRTRSGCLLPTDGLYALRTVGLTMLAARELVVTGVVTAGVIGFGPTADVHLVTMAHTLPNLSHITIYQPECRTPPPEARSVEQLAHAGVGLSIATDVDKAMLGADLVVACDRTVTRFDFDWLVRGAVLVNATGANLSSDVMLRVDQVFVDDAQLLPQSTHRAVARMGLAGEITTTHKTRQNKLINADLRHLLADDHPGRVHPEDIILVELLGVTVLDVELASCLYTVALERGLGDW